MLGALALALVALPIAGLAAAVPRTRPAWDTLPATPHLPGTVENARPLNGVNHWMQVYKAKASKDNVPVLLLHGGLGHSAYFADVLERLLAAGRTVILSDLRGHGRSTFLATDEFSFATYARDTHLALQQHGVTLCDWVGWSDGGTTTLAALMDPVIEPTIRSAFVFGASQFAADTNPAWPENPMFAEFVTRVRTEYALLQPRADFRLFAGKVQKLEATQPYFTNQHLARVPGPKVAIVEADHDNVVLAGTGKKLHDAIAGSKLIVLEGAGHFAPLQVPDVFAKAVMDNLGTVSRAAASHA